MLIFLYLVFLLLLFTALITAAKFRHTIGCHAAINEASTKSYLISTNLLEDLTKM
jgi:hypothetical protein